MNGRWSIVGHLSKCINAAILNELTIYKMTFSRLGKSKLCTLQMYAYWLLNENHVHTTIDSLVGWLVDCEANHFYIMQFISLLHGFQFSINYFIELNHGLVLCVYVILIFTETPFIRAHFCGFPWQYKINSIGAKNMLTGVWKQSDDVTNFTFHLACELGDDDGGGGKGSQGKEIGCRKCSSINSITSGAAAKKKKREKRVVRIQ